MLKLHHRENKMNSSPTLSSSPFTSAHGRAHIVKILLIVGVVTTGMSLLAEALSIAFPPPGDDQELGDNLIGTVITLAVFLLAVLDLIVYLSTIVFFLLWLYRAHKNLRAFDPWCRTAYSAGMTVGSFFIPFVNLAVPYIAVKEVWQKSRLREDAQLSEPSPPGWFPIWWLFWLLASFAGNISLRMSFNENVSESTATTVSLIADVLHIVAAMFVYLVVDGIDRRQEEASAKAKLGRFSGPPPPPANLPMTDVLMPTP